MSIQHRHRAVRDRAEARVERGKRLSLPCEFKRASELPPVPHERAAASSREAAAESAPVRLKKPPAKKRAKR